MGKLDSYEYHKRPDLVSFDDINYSNLKQVEDARKSMLREQWIKVSELKIAHEAVRKCRQYHHDDASRNCKSLILKYLKMLESYPIQGYQGYQKNDPSK
ncbi:unnamed protein product [Candida verbasci]|uniref:Uncharacterized protein n=1 Tax=Candida verbasci TaxID=1227364 RepID=A0A9W4TPC6_9ASCO|nr:unnamed protein product [Candida verbasci]